MATTQRTMRPVPARSAVQTPNQVQTVNQGASVQPTTDLLRAAIGQGNITVDLPNEATLSQAEQALSFAIGGYQRLAEASEKLKPIIGRILLHITNHKLYRPEYKNFTEYVTGKVVRGLGLSRSNAFEALKIARAFPQMSSDEYMRYGSSRLLIAAAITDGTKPDAKQILDDSTRKTVEEFRQEVKATTLQRTGETAQKVLSIRVPVEEREEFMALSERLQLPAADLLDVLLKFFVENGGPDTFQQAPPAA